MHQAPIHLSVCFKKTDLIFSAKLTTWQALKDRCRTPTRTPETVGEFRAMEGDRRDELKDVGGFVGGRLAGGSRKNGHVLGRSLGALDADHITDAKGFLARAQAALLGTAWFVYSTHSHTPETPRCRLIIPFNREVTEQEYPALLRMIASRIGIDDFDDTTYQANRLMFWPSCPVDGEFVFWEAEGEALDADAWLTKYADWRDVTGWPVSQRQNKVIARGMKQRQDPLTKPGIAGAFCRAYTVEDAIDAFLSDVYAPSRAAGRYDYIPADSTAGLVVYEGKFAYSHHATDPACERLLSAFDLVRVHRFPMENETKSCKEMALFAAADARVVTLLTKERGAKALAESAFIGGGPPEGAPQSAAGEIASGQNSPAKSPEKSPDNSPEKSPDSSIFQGAADPEAWKKLLTFEPHASTVEDSLNNLTLILQNDPKLKDIVFNQQSDGMEIRGEVPWKHPSRFWRDADDAQLISYVDRFYGFFGGRNYNIAVTKVTDDRSYHPIRDFLNALPAWDGTARVDTLLIDYLGAPDNAYVRAVTRKTFCAAISRVLHPGCKFDSMMVLNGPQGIGKSTLISRLAGEWFSDSLNLGDTRDKTAAEKLQGYWILEIGELAGLRKAEVETLRSFLSRQNDVYRASFGKRASPHPRQCIFLGTTNAQTGYLRDTTGNRRFWPVKTPGGGNKKSWDITAEEVGQFWAEVLVLTKAGEKLFLDQNIDALAKAEQRDAMESDDREGLVRDYLEALLPEGWEKLDLCERRNFLCADALATGKVGINKRESVCTMEIWCECFGKDRANLSRRDSYDLIGMLARIEGWTRKEAKCKIPLYGPQWVWVPSDGSQKVPSID